MGKMKTSITICSTAILVLMIMVACGSSDGISVRDERATAEVRATEYIVTRDAEEIERKERLKQLAPDGSEIDPDLVGNQHDDTVTYPFADYPLPPKGGVHHNSWQKCDTYDKPVLPQHAIHSMEHGAVWIAYQPELAEDIIKEIEDYGKREPYALISPYPNLSSPIVLTAWGIQLSVERPDDPKIKQFLKAFLNGVQSPEPLAGCTTGVDTVLEDPTPAPDVPEVDTNSE